MVAALPQGTTVVSGGAVGVDSTAAESAHTNGNKTLVFYPDWKRYGRSAGFRRNHDIIQNADIVWAFWDGQSRGTAHSMSLAKQYGKELITFFG